MKDYHNGSKGSEWTNYEEIWGNLVFEKIAVQVDRYIEAD